MQSKNDSKASLHMRAIQILCLGVALALGICFFACPLAAATVTVSGIVLTGWISRWAYLCYWPGFAVLCAFSVFAWRFGGKSDSDHMSRMDVALSALRPLAWWPCIVYLGFSGGWTGVALSSLFQPYGTILLAAWICTRLYEMSQDIWPGLAKRRTRSVFLVAIVVAYFVFVEIMAIRAEKYFNGGGDVCHYWGQMENLLEQGNLERSTMMIRQMDAEGISPAARVGYLKRSHMKINAEGQVYSYHSYGFPLLMALFRGDSVCGRTLVCSLLTLLASIGCYLTAREIGVGRRVALLTTGLMSLSFMWVYHGISFLPEMLGIMLAAWAFWGIIAQNRPSLRIIATIVSAIACSYLPYAHVRFLPLSLMLFGFFGVEGLLQTDEAFWSKRIPRLLLYLIICLGAWGILYYSHHVMFSAPASGGSGGAYNYRDVLMSYPLAMWGVFADQYGFVAICPLVWWMIAAPIPVFFERSCRSRWAAIALVSALAVLATCCSTRASLRGACLIGRYFVQAVPLLLPIAAYAFEKSSRLARIWYIFLSLIPIGFGIYLSICYEITGIIRAPYALWRLQTFANLWQPLYSHIDGVGGMPQAAGSVYAGGMLVFSCLILILRDQWKTRTMCAVVFAIALGAGFVSDYFNRKDWHLPIYLFCEQAKYSYFTADHPSDQDYFQTLCAGQEPKSDGPYCVLTSLDGEAMLSRRFLRTSSLKGARKIRGDMQYAVRGNSIKLQEASPAVIRIKGRVEHGTATAVVGKTTGSAVCEPVLLGPGAFDVLFHVPPSNARGFYDVYCKLLDEGGTLIVDEFLFAPYLPGLDMVLGCAL